MWVVGASLGYNLRRIPALVKLQNECEWDKGCTCK